MARGKERLEALASRYLLTNSQAKGLPSVACASLHAGIFLDRRNRYGIYGPFLESGGAASGIWWRYRLPGFGVVDWHKCADILAEIGYQGPMNIEHEDQIWGFTQDGPRMHEGLLVAKRYLEQT